MRHPCEVRLPSGDIRTVYPRPVAYDVCIEKAAAVVDGTATSNTYRTLAARVIHDQHRYERLFEAEQQTFECEGCFEREVRAGDPVWSWNVIQYTADGITIAERARTRVVCPLCAQDTDLNQRPGCDQDEVLFLYPGTLTRHEQTRYSRTAQAERPASVFRLTPARAGRLRMVPPEDWEREWLDWFQQRRAAADDQEQDAA